MIKRFPITFYVKVKITYNVLFIVYQYISPFILVLYIT